MFLRLLLWSAAQMYEKKKKAQENDLQNQAVNFPSKIV